MGGPHGRIQSNQRRVAGAGGRPRPAGAGANVHAGAGRRRTCTAAVDALVHAHPAGAASQPRYPRRLRVRLGAYVYTYEWAAVARECACGLRCGRRRGGAAVLRPSQAPSQTVRCLTSVGAALRAAVTSCNARARAGRRGTACSVGASACTRAQCALLLHVCLSISLGKVVLCFPCLPA